MITIVPYKPSWPDEFAALAALLRLNLGSLALRIDHIGSTSVPDLPAKDIIDIQVTVADLEPFAPLQSAVAAAGFVARTDIDRDHQPPGYAGPAAAWAKRYFSNGPNLRRCHLHMRVAGRPNQRYPLLFRDYLRAHPAAAAAYAALKRRLAEYHGNSSDHTAYVTIKDPVCDLIMAAAEDWAAQSRWHVAPSDA